MGLIVLLIGFLALSAGGLISLAPAEEQLANMPADSLGQRPQAMPVSAYVPASAEEADAIKTGDPLFRANCAQCHAVHDKVIGPALAGIGKRRPISWITRWVRNSAKVIASGDEYAVKLYDDNGKQQMPSFPSLTDKEIAGIMAWVASEEGNNAQPRATGAVVVN
ncbi:cytochrome c [Hymenobacter sp. H14-R3]|uniref:c-type cytochrome n=1 Tax=Hymenobacter sp. H14-R3 TaxID=3046308 RepID=UPI0024BB6E36|nr:cytochrome c [Hymenobacter sp. H14-R3]